MNITKPETVKPEGSRSISDNRLLARYRSEILGKTQNHINHTVFPVGCLFTSTLAERRALAWLLASDRVQASGQDELQMDGVLFDMFDEQGSPTQLQIKFAKGRSKRDFKTPVYKRGPMCQRSCRLMISEDNHAPLLTGT